MDILNETPLKYQYMVKTKQTDEIIPNFKKKLEEDNKKYEYQEDDIQVYDKKINETIIKNIYHFCMNKEISWNQHNSNSENSMCFFKCDVYDNLYFHTLFHNVIIPNINYKNRDKLKICRAYINLHLPGCPGDWHYDNPGLGPTILLYIHVKWNTRWEGQTAFYINLKKKEIKYVDFVPGRIVLFEPNIMHRACDLSNYANMECVCRYTLAFHTYFE
jgi:hypothetical protein